MKAIGIGLVGLSSNGSWTATAHMPYLAQTPKYRIAALCNSSLPSGAAAARHFRLPASVKTYASSADLAHDPDVELVVCSVRVDKHYDICRAAVEAGKDCFAEWPLGRDAREAQDLRDLARRAGVRTVIGLPGRQNPFVNAVKGLVEGGAVGRILSSTVVSFGGRMGARDPEGLSYLNERGVGGNLVTIFFGHLMDMVLYTLGELNGFRTLFFIQRPQVQIIDADFNVIDTIPRISHDQILLHGTLRSGAVLSVHQRGGPPFKNTPGLLWRIYGETGEIDVSSRGSFPHLESEDMQIRLHDFVSDEVTVVDWEKAGEGLIGGMSAPVADVASIYEAFAEGRSGYADWSDAVERQRMLDEVYASFEEQREGSYTRPV